MMFGKQYVLDETFSKFALTFLCLIQDFKYQLTSAIHLLTDTIFRKGNCLTIISTVYFRCTSTTAKILNVINIIPLVDNDADYVDLYFVFVSTTGQDFK